MTDDEIVDIVDEFVDDINTERLQGEAERLGITVENLLTRIETEVKVRLGI